MTDSNLTTSVAARFAAEGTVNGLSLGSKAGHDAWLSAMTATQGSASTSSGSPAPAESKTSAGGPDNPVSSPLPSDLAAPDVVASLEAGFEPPASPVDYRLGVLAGPDADLGDVAAVSHALHASGVPASFVAEASKIIDRGAANPMDDATFDLAVSKVRANLIQKHGAEAATAIAVDALAYFDAIGSKNPKLGAAVEHLLTSEWALATAATMYRVAKAKAAR